jgi:hypothetical protein
MDWEVTKLGSLLRTAYAACRWTMRFEASEMEYYLLKLDSLIFRNRDCVLYLVLGG